MCKVVFTFEYCAAALAGDIQCKWLDLATGLVSTFSAVFNGAISECCGDAHTDNDCQACPKSLLKENRREDKVYMWNCPDCEARTGSSI